MHIARFRSEEHTSELQSPSLFLGSTAAADEPAAAFFPFRAAASVAGASVAEAFLFGAMAVVARENRKSLGARTMEQEREEEDGTGAARRANV